MGSRYDAGNILLQRVLNRDNLSSYVAVRTAIYLQNFELIADAIELIFQNNLSPKDGLAQNEKEAIEWKAIGSEEMKKVLPFFSTDA